MKQVSVLEAKTHLSALLRRVETGEEVIISRGGKPIARIVPLAPLTPRQWGLDRGLFTVPDDFDDPLPEGLLRLWEGDS